MTFWSDFLSNDGRSAEKWAHYFPVYERHLARFQNRRVTVLEIGCGRGGSLPLWSRYFGPDAQIVGIDIRPECKEYEKHPVLVRIGNQSDPRFIDGIANEFGPFDVVLDDGSHVMSDITASFRMLYPRMDRHGVYIVEDLHTAYWPQYGGGLRRQGSFVEIAKELIDELNGGDPTDMPLTEFAKSTASISFYNSMVVFERGPLLNRFAKEVGSGIDTTYHRIRLPTSP